MDLARKHTNLFNYPAGQFLVAGTASVTAWGLVWPLEVLKNLTQAETKGVGVTTLDKARYIMRNHGLKGFYRGFVPGSQSVFFRSGAAMIAMQKAQNTLTAAGFRD